MQINRLSRTALLAAFLLAGTSAFALAQPKVIASIVPVHALVTGVMEGLGEPSLLLMGLNSEHQASYTPAQLTALGEADLVFMIGNGLELKLDELSGSEAVKGKRFVALSASKELTKLKIRSGGTWDSHDHDHDHDHDEGHEAEGHETDQHGTSEYDPHIWLDPNNAKVMVAKIADELGKADTANAERYQANAKKMMAELDVLAKDVEAVLASVKDTPFVVFHDAYQYFDARFGLSGVGSISDFAANAPSAKRLKDVRDKIAAVKAVCVFREPQFSDAAVTTAIEGTDARAGILDPIGATLTPGKGAYRKLLMGLAQSLKACLAPT